jgi:hypothetical protein
MVGPGLSPERADRMTTMERLPLARSGAEPIPPSDLLHPSMIGPNSRQNSSLRSRGATPSTDSLGPSLEREPEFDPTSPAVPDANTSVRAALGQLRTSMARARTDHGRANRSSSSRAVLRTAAEALAQLEQLSRHEAVAAERVAALARSASSYSALPPGDPEELRRAAETLARALGSCERIAAEWEHLAATSNRLRESVERQARGGPQPLDGLAREMLQTLDTFLSMEAGEPSGSGPKKKAGESSLPAAATRHPPADQVPTHPCATCAHATEAECTAVAEGLKAERGGQCRDCLHECLHRAMPNPSPPGAMIQPNVLVPNVMSPPMPVSPTPDLGPPPGTGEPGLTLG